MMKKALRLALLVTLVAVTAGLAACGQGVTVNNSGQTTNLKFAFQDFTRLNISGSFVVDVEPSDGYSINVTVDQNVFEYLKVSKRGDTLYVGLESGNTYVNTIQRAVIKLPALAVLTLSGASQATVGKFPGAKSLELDLSGSSKASVVTDNLTSATFDLSGTSRVTGTLDAAAFTLKLNDASSASLEGNAPDLSVTGTRASIANLRNLLATTLKVDLSGASTATVNVLYRIDATLKDGSNVTYLGDPAMGNLDISGGSTMKKGG